MIKALTERLLVKFGAKKGQPEDGLAKDKICLVDV